MRFNALGFTDLRDGRRSPDAVAQQNLSLDIAFLRRYGIGETHLRHAQLEAKRLDAFASEVLIAQEVVSAARYYLCLADTLGTPFIGAGAFLDRIDDPGAAVRRGYARLAHDPGKSVPRAKGARHDGWLMAPRGDKIGLLLLAKQYGLALPALAITTPAHFSALVRRSARTQFARDASDGLAGADPGLCAKPAVETVRSWKGAGVIAIAAALAVAAPRWTMLGLGPLFFAAIAGRLVICALGLSETRAPTAIPAGSLPLYGVIVPLYHEAEMVPSLLKHLKALDYPTSKLEIKILIEADDPATRVALEQQHLPPHFEIIIAPEGFPRAKPRALNMALALMRAELVTVYDAEDMPEPGQLRKAAARFHRAPPELACLQASLVIDSGRGGLLAKLFAIEYAALFDVFNKGVAEAGLPLALGGTSNHFRTRVLRRAGGWDAWNVAEDADIGFRLARLGYKIEMLASTTSEQAPATLPDWFKQRRRWTKGWIQTILVLALHPCRTLNDLGFVKTMALVLMSVSLVAGPLLSPFVALAMIVGLWTDGLPDPRDGLDTAAVSLWVSVLVIGLLAPVWCGCAGIRSRKLQWCWSSLLFVVPYQLLIAAAAWFGLFDLVRTPYHWHKTKHYPPAAHPSRRSRVAGAPAPETPRPVEKSMTKSPARQSQIDRLWSFGFSALKPSAWNRGSASPATRRRSATPNLKLARLAGGIFRVTRGFAGDFVGNDAGRAR